MRVRRSLLPASQRALRTVYIGVLAAALLSPMAATAAQAAPNLVLGFDATQQIEFQYDKNDPASGATYVATVGVNSGELVIPAQLVDSNDPGAPILSVTRLGSALYEYDGTFDKVVVPGSVETFDYRLFRRATVHELELSEGVSSVDERAFRNIGLTTLTLPSSLTTLGDEAFADNELTSLSLPDSIQDAGNSAFARNKLSNITLAEGTRSIGQSMFAGNELDSLSLPGSVTTIGNGAFANNFISEVTLGPQVQVIGSQAFINNSLHALNIPRPNIVIGAMAFAYNNLSSLTLPEGLVSVPDSAFLGNELLDVQLPASLVEIGPAAFALNELRELTFGDNLVTIGDSAFAVNKLRRVTFGSAIQDIAPWAFSENPGLTRVLFTGPPPLIIGAGDDESASLGDADGLVVLYPRALGGSDSATFSAPNWRGYSASPSVLIVSYEVHGGKSIPVDEVAYDSLPSVPAQAVKRGATFRGWFSNAQLSEVFDQSAPLTHDVTLHAGWRSQASPPSGSQAPGNLADKTTLPSTGTSAEGLLIGVIACLLLVVGAGLIARRRNRLRSKR